MPCPISLTNRQTLSVSFLVVVCSSLLALFFYTLLIHKFPLFAHNFAIIAIIIIVREKNERPDMDTDMVRPITSIAERERELKRALYIHNYMYYMLWVWGTNRSLQNMKQKRERGRDYVRSIVEDKRFELFWFKKDSETH